MKRVMIQWLLMIFVCFHVTMLQAQKPNIVIGEDEKTVLTRNKEGNLVSHASDSELGVIHHIVFGSTEDISTKSIGKSVQESNRLMTGLMRVVGRSTGMEVQTHSFLGSNFSKANLDNFLATFKCRPNDVIFFNYLGHGFRYDDTKGKWPFLLVQQRSEDRSLEEYAAASIYLGELHQKLKDKGARLTITSAEACNNSLGKAPKGIVSYDFGIDKEGYIQLFKHYSGAYMSSSAVPSQKSWADDNGGYYTNAFLNAIGKISKQKKAADWANVFELTKKYTAIIVEDKRSKGIKISKQTTQYEGSASIIDSGVKVKTKR